MGLLANRKSAAKVSGGAAKRSVDITADGMLRPVIGNDLIPTGLKLTIIKTN